MTIHVAGANVF